MCFKEDNVNVRIDLITIWTDNIEVMRDFYSETLGFEIESDLGEHVEFKSQGVRFSLCSRSVFHDVSQIFREPSSGQSFELAFPCDGPKDVDKSYEELLDKGTKGIKAPQDMPWGQRTALFSDPDGNIHEIFAYLK